VPIALSAPQPDVLVGDDGRTVAVRGGDGRYQIMGGKGASFEIENWLRADADTRRPTAKELSAGVLCDALGCIAKLGAGDVALVLAMDAFMEDCGRAALVVTPLTAPRFCSGETTVVDRVALARSGAEALFFDSEGRPGEADAKPSFRIETAYPAIRRPFMPPIPDPDHRPAASISSGG
jgi:competence protein ComEC